MWFKRDTQPGEIINAGLNQCIGATDGVDVLETQQQAAFGFARHLFIQQSRVGVAEMQAAIGAGCKTENGLAHESICTKQGTMVNFVS